MNPSPRKVNNQTVRFRKSFTVSRQKIQEKLAHSESRDCSRMCCSMDSSLCRQTLRLGRKVSSRMRSRSSLQLASQWGGEGSMESWLMMSRQLEACTGGRLLRMGDRYIFSIFQRLWGRVVRFSRAQHYSSRAFAYPRSCSNQQHLFSISRHSVTSSSKPLGLSPARPSKTAQELLTCLRHSSTWFWLRQSRASLTCMTAQGTVSVFPLLSKMASDFLIWEMPSSRLPHLMQQRARWQQHSEVFSWPVPQILSMLTSELLAKVMASSYSELLRWQAEKSSQSQEQMGWNYPKYLVAMRMQQSHTFMYYYRYFCFSAHLIRISSRSKRSREGQATSSQSQSERWGNSESALEGETKKERYLRISDQMRESWAGMGYVFRFRWSTSASKPLQTSSLSSTFMAVAQWGWKRAGQDLLTVLNPTKFFSLKKMLDLKASSGRIFSQCTSSLQFSISEMTKCPRSMRSKFSSNPQQALAWVDSTFQMAAVSKVFPMMQLRKSQILKCRSCWCLNSSLLMTSWRVLRRRVLQLRTAISVITKRFWKAVLRFSQRWPRQRRLMPLECRQRLNQLELRKQALKESIYTIAQEIATRMFLEKVYSSLLQPPLAYLKRERSLRMAPESMRQLSSSSFLRMSSFSLGLSAMRSGRRKSSISWMRQRLKLSGSPLWMESQQDSSSWMITLLMESMKLLWILDRFYNWDSQYWISLNLMDFLSCFELALKRARKPLYSHRDIRGTLSFSSVPRYSQSALKLLNSFCRILMAFLLQTRQVSMFYILLLMSSRPIRASFTYTSSMSKQWMLLLMSFGLNFACFFERYWSWTSWTMSSCVACQNWGKMRWPCLMYLYVQGNPDYSYTSFTFIGVIRLKFCASTSFTSLTSVRTVPCSLLRLGRSSSKLLMRSCVRSRQSLPFTGSTLTALLLLRYLVLTRMGFMSTLGVCWGLGQEGYGSLLRMVVFKGDQGAIIIRFLDLAIQVDPLGLGYYFARLGDQGLGGLGYSFIIEFNFSSGLCLGVPIFLTYAFFGLIPMPTSLYSLVALTLEVSSIGRTISRSFFFSISIFLGEGRGGGSTIYDRLGLMALLLVEVIFSF